MVLTSFYNFQRKICPRENTRINFFKLARKKTEEMRALAMTF